MGAADSKLAFKKGVFRLFEERNIPAAANDYWEQFWTLPESVYDVFLLVGSQDIRRVRDEAPENLECLIEKILGHLFQLCESREFLKPETVATQVLNCVRVLTRIFPFVFESEALRGWEELYFWSRRTNTISVEKRTYSTEQFIIPEVGPATDVEARSISIADEARSEKTQRAIEELAESAPIPGLRLIKTLLDLLFTSGFTLPTALETKTGVSYVIWETGVGSSKPIGTSKELDDNRTEILRLLLVLFSRSMYISPSVITTAHNPWIDAVVTGSDRQATLTILCSLINSALKYNPSGWGLPYNHVVSNDQRELLAMLCLQVIVVLLDYEVIVKAHTVSGNTAGRSDEHLSSADSVPTAPPFSGMACESTDKNQFRYYLSRLHREQDFTFLTDGMCRILSNPMAANSSYLPGSTKQVKCHLETLMLCWKTVEINKRFRNYLLNTKRVLDVVVILIYFSLEYKQDSSQIGLVRMCACMLQTLSKDRAFGYSLNTSFEGHTSLPANVRIPNFHGTYGDYLICSVHHLVTTTKRALRPLYPALISTLFNVSPYIKNLSHMASSRLLQLTISFASPSFLLAEEANHELLGVLLDTLCSILYYQGLGNPCLIYSLVQCESKIQTLAQFTLKRGLDGIHKLRYQRPETLSSAIFDKSESKADNTCHRRPAAPGQQPHRGSYEEISQQHLWQSHSLTCDDSTATENSNTRVHPRSSLRATFASPGSMPSSSSSSPSCSSNQADSATMPALERRDITGSVHPPSDGCGHEGDVEDEGGPYAVRRNSRDRSFHGISEKARGKLPEKSNQSFSTLIREELSCGLEREAVEFNDVKYPYNFSKTATSSRRLPLSSRMYSNFQQEQIATAHDVGQNGFVPTDDWVQGWMGRLRFDPLLMLLRYVIPEIESIHAVNEQQVLDHIRTSIIPKLHQVLPKSGRPPILVRKFVWSEFVVWFQEVLWSQIYVGGGGRLGRQGSGAWFETGVKLFCVRTTNASLSTAAAPTDSMASVAAAAAFQMAGTAPVDSSS